MRLRVPGYGFQVGFALVLGASYVLSAQSPVTVFEGGRVIVGDGKVIDNASIVVTGDRITQVGPAASIKAPAGATRVSIAGKTVMPAIVDAHVHTSTTAPELENDLRRRAAWLTETGARRLEAALPLLRKAQAKLARQIPPSLIQRLARATAEATG